MNSLSINSVQLPPLWQGRDDRAAVFHMLRHRIPTLPGSVKPISRCCSGGRQSVEELPARDSKLRVRPPSCEGGPVRRSIGVAERGAIMDVLLTPEEDSLLAIPPPTWHGFPILGKPLSILGNCATEASDPAQVDRLDPSSDRIRYRWNAEEHA